jgi:hypothetical protein
LTLQQIKRVVEAIVDGGAAITWVGMVDRVTPLGDIRGEGRDTLNAAVKVDDGDLVGSTPKDGGEHDLQVVVVFELTAGGSSRLH